MQTVIKEVDPYTLKKWLLEDDILLFDVREQHEYDAGHIPGCRLVPLSIFETVEFTEDKDKKAVFYCGSSKRTGENACRFLNSGFKDVYHLAGGICAWNAVDMDIEIDE